MMSYCKDEAAIAGEMRRKWGVNENDENSSNNVMLQEAN